MPTNENLESEMQSVHADKAYQQGNYDVALSIWLKLVSAGSSEAAYRIGELFYYGKGVEKNFQRAMEYYARAKGHAEAILSIAHMYQYGQGVAQDFEKAFLCYEQSAMLGSPKATYKVGASYRMGFGVKLNYAKALDWFRKASIRIKLSTQPVYF